MYGGELRHAGPGDVLIGLLMFYCCGAAIIAKGHEHNSIGAMVVGGWLVAAGIYYTIKYWLASGWKNKN